MYALSKETRPGVDDDGDDDRPLAPPPRDDSKMSAQSTSLKTSGNGGVAAAIRAAKKPASRESQGQYEEQEYEGTYASVEKTDTAMPSTPATTPGAVSVPGIAANYWTIAPNSSNPTLTPYQDSFAVRSSPATQTVNQEVKGQADVPTSMQDSLIEATRVEDEEADVEAQVQSRMHDQAKDIAQMVHKELVQNMAVPVDVQPSVGNTSSITTKGQDNRSSEEDARKRRLCLVAIGLLAIVAAVGAGVGVAISKRSEPTPPDDCSFCHNGFVPTNLDNETVVFEGKTCAEFFERQTSLDPTDPKCTSGQAIAWDSCDCPTLPLPPENPTCTLCEDGEVPTGAYCKDYDNFIAIVDDVLASCDYLRTAVFAQFDCTCGKDDEDVALQSVLEPLSGEALKDTDSPQFEALDWIANKDAAKLSVQTTDVDSIKTRYVAALLYHAFGGRHWSERYKFLTEGDVCTWNENGLGGFEFGIVCDSSGNIETLRLPDNNLVGSIPPEIGYFSNLRNVDMANNTIGGVLPTSLANSTRLEYLNLTENALTGTLSEFLFNHQQLTHIQLDDNSFSGTLSPSLGSSPKLTVFWVRNSKLTGSIPSNVGRSSVLGTVDFHSNQLTGALPEFTAGSNIFGLYVGENKLVGTVPTSIGNMRLLETFAAHANSFNGPIPSEIGQCTNLRELFVHNNTFMTGTLPTELGTPRLMRYVYLSDNRFEGGIPSEIGNLRLLQRLSIYDNRFNGTIPTELRGCASLGFVSFEGNYFSGNLGAALDSFPRILHTFDVSENQLTGTIPTLIGEFSSLKWFDVQSNELLGTIPTEVGSLSELETFVVAYNGFTGTVPSILASLPKLTWLRAQGNEFTGDLNAFCAGTFESLVGNVCSEPETLDCACCTHCCRLDTFECPPL